MARDEHDLRVIPVRGLALEVQSVDVRKLHIQNQAGRHVGLRIREVLGGGTERDHVQVEGRKKRG